MLDTGSADLWVTSKNCTTCTQGNPSFDKTASSTFQAVQNSTGQPVTAEITYGSGVVSGNVVKDTVAMGDFQVPSQSWLLVERTSGGILTSFNDGIMGLAFKAAGFATPFWQSLTERNKLAIPEMSFWLTRRLGDPNAQDHEFGGVFTLGGQNKTLYKGDVEFLPLVTLAGRQTHWLLNVSGMYPICTRLALDSFSPTGLNPRDHGQRRDHHLAA